MIRSGGQKENHTSNAYELRDRKDDGTAARTRPLSFEEIMERRKNRELSQPMNNKVGVVEIISRNDTVQDISARPVPLRGGRETIRLSSVIERPAIEEHVRESNRGKEDSLRTREEKSVRGISGGMKELHFKEERSSTKEGMQVKANRKRESAAELRSNLISEGWNGDNRGEMEKKIHSGNKNYERRGDPKGGRLRREIRNVGYRDEIEQKIHSRIGKDEQLRNYREDRVRRNEPRNTGTRGEIDRKNNSRSNNNEWSRNKSANQVPGKRECKTDQRNHWSKDDKWPRNDSDDKINKAYVRDSVINDRYADRSEGKFEKESKRKRHNADDRDVRDKNAIKKPDLGRSRDSEVAEKEEKELPGSCHENSRMKRKRSRSEERGKNRETSPSLSHEARKVMSYNGRKVGDSLSHSLKDTPGKQREDMERSKFSSNGLGNHYRGHGGSTSGLGGYSPRKRKTENVARPLSPTNGSLERKNAGWDIPPTGVRDTSGSVTEGPQLSDHQVLSLNVNELVGAVTAALNASKPLPGASGFFHAENASVDSIQLTESTRPMRRLYIENIPASASEKDVMEYLNSRLVSLGVNHIQGKQPCISCIIHKEKCQALIEFLTPEDASAALSFDGSSFSGAILKIRRPKDFVEMATSDTSEAAKSAATVTLSNIIKDSPHKVFIGGISEALSAEMLIEIVSAFGQLKAFYFDARQDSLNRYAFLEYVDQSVTVKACAGLNGMKFGGQVLTVIQALPSTLPMEISEREPTYGIPDRAKPLLEMPSQVIKLKNLLTPEGMFLLSKLEIEEVLEDVRLECARFGTVKSLNVVGQETIMINNSQEKCVDHNDDKSVEGEENLGHDGSIFSGTSRDVTRTVTEELREVGAESFLREDEERGYTSDPKSICYEKNMNNVIGSELPKHFAIKTDPNDGTPDVPSTENSNQPSILVAHIEYPESKESETSRRKEEADETKESAGKESNLEQDKASSREAMTGNGVTEEQDFDLAHVFELGSVFVEYKRTEGSCTAAHALHGRLFDERVVMVEYVPLELYQAKFQR